MRKSLTILIGIIFVLSMANATPSQQTLNPMSEINYFHDKTGLNKQILKDAFNAYQCAVLHGYHHQKDLLTIIDFQLPDYRKRMWVLDLKNKKILFWTYVTHGSGSGWINAKRFSNTPNSYESSLGLYETGQSYYGEWGYSMRLHGLEKYFNSNAFARAIVLHSGDYVGKNVVKEYGRIGESHGCMVIPIKYDHSIINTLKGGSLIFAYYPEKNWLTHSQFLHCPIAQG